MSGEILSSRAIMGMYYARLDVATGRNWIPRIANQFNSDQESESYAFLGQSPAMRLWIGGRNPKTLKTSKFAIDNSHYESTMEFLKREVRRDKTGQILARINDFADRSITHWASLLSAIIRTNPTCYDTNSFFSTTHSEENSGTQSNDVSVTISTLPCVVHGTTTAPSVEEMQQCIMKSIAQITSFVDNQAEPMNENANQFLVMCPVNLYQQALAAVSKISLHSQQQDVNPNNVGFQVDVVQNPRLNADTTKFYTFRTDAALRPLIAQSEQEVELKVKAEGSEYEFDNDAWQFGIDAWRGVGVGYWQYALRTTLA